MTNSIRVDCARYAQDKVLSILRINEELSGYKDVDAILDKILLECRTLFAADAGSIFLVQEDALRFAYVQNDTLFPEDESNAALYANFTVPIDKRSIVGYAALTGQTLDIVDAYQLSPDLPYAFNPDFDQRSGYRTRSMLTLPIKTFEDRLVGVIQLLNARDETGAPCRFSQEAKTYAPLFANTASLAIERGIMNRELILRMVKTAELRDPAETGAHVQRVGAYCAEIYRTWAQGRGLGLKTVLAGVDTIRLAAMLHDVGKVGVSDLILKKPARLTDEERRAMQMHTLYGATLFENCRSPLERMSRDIALNHHEQWGGGGYPGVEASAGPAGIVLGRGKRGKDISVEARIAALADVFDALSSRRSYKEPWSDEKVLAHIEDESGRHFDPEVVEAFFAIWDVIRSIRAKFPDEA